MTEKQLARRIAKEIMMRRGWGDYSPDHVEWDEDNDNSQFSLVMEDVTIVLEILDAEGLIGDLEAIE